VLLHTGALGDYPDVTAKVVELPAGPAGKGTPSDA
jgi:multiple sugar transport system substrate-binding protein